MSTEYDLINQKVITYTDDQDAYADAMTRQFKAELGECDLACSWHPVYGWAPEDGCPVHDVAEVEVQRIIKYQHFCPDWDFLEIDKNSPEIMGCTCKLTAGVRDAWYAFYEIFPYQ